MPAQQHAALQIGDWCVHASLDQITRDGKSVKLEPRAMGVLMCLAGHAGQVVTVDQLLDAVWKDVVVTPDSVYQAVGALRKALGDDSKEPTYIANVVRRGYRLVAPVTPWVEPRLIHSQNSASTSAAASPGSPFPLAAGSPKGRGRGRWRRSGAAITLVVGAVFLLGHYGVWSGSRAPDVTTPELRAQSVAVMPFLDLSDTRDQQYFADGLTEELIERLTSVPRLHVVARSSSFYFKGKQATVTQIARTLGVSYLLEGSVRKAGNGIRVTAHMVRGDDGYDLWSETYNRPLADIFNIQDEIAGAVVQVLKISVVPPESNVTSNPAAYTEFLRALEHVDRGFASDYETADMQLHAALRLDPQFAGAWALLAAATVWKFDVRAPNPTPEACAIAHGAADRALEFGPTISQTHRAKGIVLQSCDADLNGARAEFDRALQLQPDDPLLLMSQARLAAERGQADSSIEFARRATAVDPLNPWTFSSLGDVYLYSAHPMEAELAYRKAIQINSSLAYNHSALAIALLTNHEPTEAVTESEREPDPQYRLMVRPIALDAAGRKNDAEQGLEELKQRYGEENADWVALFYACRHNSDAAIQWLRNYLVRHKRLVGYQPYLMNCLNNLGNDPRYQEIRRQLKASGGG
jgi:TolB-like protein/DNA-binding winged helix-turn-helix (wHTH) protein/tetratricopeptide (TPR) repeat protein